LLHRGTGQNVDLDWTIDNSSGVSLVTVSFSGSLTEANGSLIDGNYQLNIDGSLLGGSTPGQDYVFGDEASDNFYRYFGDSDGNRSVNVFDLLDFRRTYRQSSGDVGYDASHDGDGDGDVDVFDLLRFRRNYNTTFQWS